MSPDPPREFVMVGGPEHGKIRAMRSGDYLTVLNPSRPVAEWLADWAETDPNEELDATRIEYTKYKVMYMMPGRTDYQLFPVFAIAQDAPLLEEALIKAWATGWSPPPETSEVWINPWEPWNPNGWKP